MADVAPMQLFVAVVAAGATLAALGVALIVVGRRGKRIGDHPHCRRCGFDLFGLPATSRRCPECGADLTARRAILAGGRMPRPRWVALGVIVALLALTATAFLALRVGRTVDWAAQVPTWWLLHRAQSNDPATLTAALDALTVRGDFDKQVPGPDGTPRYVRVYTAAQEEKLLDRVLAVQADASLPWKPTWGDVFVYRIEEQSLSVPRYEAFVRASCGRVKLAARPRVRRGDPLPMRLELDDSRQAAARPWLLVDVNLDATSVDGQPLPIDPKSAYDGGGVAEYSSSYGWSGAIQPGPALDAMVPRKHRVTCRVNVKWTDIHRAFLSDQGGDTCYTSLVKVEASAESEIVSRDLPSVEMIEDESLRPAMQGALAATPALTRHLEHVAMAEPFMSIRLPMAASWRITLRQGTRQWPLGAIAGDWYDARLGGDAPGLRPGVADLIFTADPAPAAATVDVVRAWRGDIVLKNVPILDGLDPRAGPTVRPTRSVGPPEPE